jgi:hypothetical protein
LSGSPVFKNAEGLMPYPKQRRMHPSKVWQPDSASGYDESLGMRTNPNEFSSQRIHEVMEDRRKREEIDWFDWQFVGLVHGHFDVKDFTEDAADDVMQDAICERNEINTGIAIVIPARKVLETIFQHGLQKELWDMIRIDRKEHGATADVNLSDKTDGPKKVKAAPESDNPAHKEDFTSLLGEAARTPPQDD